MESQLKITTADGHRWTLNWNALCRNLQSPERSSPQRLATVMICVHPRSSNGYRLAKRSPSSPTPISPPTGPATGSSNGLHPESKFLAFIHSCKGRGGEGGIPFNSLPFLMRVGDFGTLATGCVSVLCPGNDAGLSKSVKAGLGSFEKIGRKAPWLLLIRPASRAFRNSLSPPGMHSTHCPPSMRPCCRRIA